MVGLGLYCVIDGLMIRLGLIEIMLSLWFMVSV